MKGMEWGWGKKATLLFSDIVDIQTWHSLSQKKKKKKKEEKEKDNM